jgi:hypothetical protein
MGKLKKPLSQKNSQKIVKNKDNSAKKDVKRKGHVVKISTPLSRISKKIISKKDKKKLKQEKVLNGILQTRKKFREEKERKKREKTVTLPPINIKTKINSNTIILGNYGRSKATSRFPSITGRANYHSR